VKPQAILYDLDDTLLVNPVEEFVPAYLKALSAFVAATVEPELLSRSLLEAIRVMDRNTDPGRTNAEVFFDAFLPPLGRPQAELEVLFARFYRDVFPQLRPMTRPMEGAGLAVDWARATIPLVAVATNPVFPATAIHQRIRWADLDTDRFDLITTLESCHATKAHPAYYREITDRLDVSASACVMVGDNWRWDVVNPIRAGMAAWWIADVGADRPDPDLSILGQGPLTEFVAFARSTWG
jgi:FMN phosphatase YigB (HAD superfamily)